jgi:hypothetical protein
MDGVNINPAPMSAIIPNAQEERSWQALRLADASIRAQASRLASQNGAGAVNVTQFNYTMGPDGQLYATSATVSASRRTVGPANPNLPLSQQNGTAAQPLSLRDFQPVNLGLSPSDEAAVFGSKDFLEETLGSNASQVRAQLQIIDFGVRAQEGQHFRAAAGLGSAPEYDYHIGPDGELYAVAGSVGISTGSAATPEEAAADASTMARAALAATDVSAQDVSVARNAQAKAASFYAAANDITQQETPRLQLAA